MNRVSIGKEVTFVSRQIIKLRNKYLKDYKCIISAAHVHAFIFFAHNSGASEKQATAAIGKDKTSVTKSVRKLYEQQLIIRIPDDKDARIKRITLTQKGHYEMNKVSRALETVSVIMSKGIEQERINAFLKTLAAIQDNIQDDLGERQ